MTLFIKFIMLLIITSYSLSKFFLTIVEAILAIAFI